MDDFAAENVLLGIVQLGITDHVLEVTNNIERSIRTRSLRSAILKIIELNPADFDPVILTPERILHVRNLIEDYELIPRALVWNQAKTW